MRANREGALPVNESHVSRFLVYISFLSYTQTFLLFYLYLSPSFSVSLFILYPFIYIYMYLFVHLSIHISLSLSLSSACSEHRFLAGPLACLAAALCPLAWLT